MTKLVKQLLSLQVTDTEYYALYVWCHHEFPMAIQDLPKPVLSGTPAATMAFQQQPMPGTANPSAGATYVPPTRKPDSCAFCMNYSHCIHDCLVTQDYVTHGLAVLHDSCIKLPTYVPVPNDGTGHGIKFSLDQWLATQHAPGTQVTPTTAVVPAVQPVAFHRDEPPHWLTKVAEVIQTNIILQVIDSASPHLLTPSFRASLRLLTLHQMAVPLLIQLGTSTASSGSLVLNGATRLPPPC